MALICGINKEMAELLIECMRTQSSLSYFCLSEVDNYQLKFYMYEIYW